MASRARSAWVVAGVEMATACAPAPARSASESKAPTPGWSFSSSARRSGDVVTTPMKSISGADAIRGAWKTRPPRPYPTKPKRTMAASLRLDQATRARLLPSLDRQHLERRVVRRDRPQLFVGGVRADAAEEDADLGLPPFQVRAQHRHLGVIAEL